MQMFRKRFRLQRWNKGNSAFEARVLTVTLLSCAIIFGVSVRVLLRRDTAGQ